MFRGLIIPISIVACDPYLRPVTGPHGTDFMTISTIVLCAPIYFIIAHIHHLYEQLRHINVFEAKNRGVVLNAILIMCVQMTYTGIFGVIAGFLFVRTGNICSCIASHMICNIMQLPDISFTNPYFYMYKYRYILLFIHGFGLICFYYCLFPFTENMAKNSILWL